MIAGLHPSGVRPIAMNAIGTSAPVFIALLLLGWMWGFWGMVLGVLVVLAARILRRHASRKMGFRMERARAA